MKPIAPPLSTHLTEYGDVLTVREVCAVLRISDRHYRRLRQHGAWTIPELPHLPHHYAKRAVERFLESGGAQRLKRAS